MGGTLLPTCTSHYTYYILPHHTRITALRYILLPNKWHSSVYTPRPPKKQLRSRARTSRTSVRISQVNEEDSLLLSNRWWCYGTVMYYTTIFSY